MATTKLGRSAGVTALASSIAVVVLLAFAGSAQALAPAWKVLSVTGPTNLPTSPSERQTIKPPALGTYTLTFNGSTTGPLAADAAASAIQTALNGLSTVSAGGGSVTVTAGTTVGTFDVVFDGGPLAGTDLPLMTITPSIPVPASVSLPQSGTIAIYPFNVGGAQTDGTYSVTITLPGGIVTSGDAISGNNQSLSFPYNCGSAGFGQTTVTCTRSLPVKSGASATSVMVPVAVSPGISSPVEAHVSVSGGGAASAGEYVQPITVSDTPAGHGVQAFFAGAFDENGNPETRAGAHPFTAMAAFLMNSALALNGKVNPVGATKRIDVDLPAGFIANPLIAERCARDRWYCGSWVGDAGYQITNFGTGFNRARVGNVLPPKGSPAQLSFQTIDTKASVTGKVRPTDFGVTSLAENITNDFPLFGSFVTLWGQPGLAMHDELRCPQWNLTDEACPEPASSPIADAFVTNPTECSGEDLPTLIGTFAWQQPALLSGPVGSDSPPVTDCELVPFAPAVGVASTSTVADSASGLDFDVALAQDGLLDPDGIATSHLKDVTVELPEGVAVNPAGATGLAGCSDAQMQVGTDTPPSCPDGSRIGTVRITSPLVDRAIGGTMYLGTPKSTDPISGEMLRLFVVARDDDLGILVKLPGSSTADPVSGKLVATFENNPRLPFDHLTVKLKGGDRGVLATPTRCNATPGQYRSVSSLLPWSRAHLALQDQDPSIGEQNWTIDGDCDYGFDPSLKAGMSNAAAAKSGAFGFEFTRPQGDQWVKGLTAELPPGLLASVKDIPLCANAQANAGNCPAASRIGTVDASAGSGDPFVLEEKGEAFLTEGYKGGPYGLAVKVRAIAGPFRGAFELSPIVVRQKITVDPVTAQVKAISDPFPTIWHGVPLRVRRVLVNVDRLGFMLNPTDCSAKQVNAAITSTEGIIANRSNPFQATGCAALPFKPKLTLALTGRKQTTTGKHPGVKATVTQTGIGEAGIKKAEVRLPKSLALDPDNAQALCEFVDGTKDDLENHCLKRSIVGRAKAVSPLLNDPLVGNVYFVKNVRIDPKTGNQIRTLPMIVVALRGEIAVNLRGESDTTKSGKLVNTFASVPDAPINQFNLNIRGGRTGILAVTRTRRATSTSASAATPPKPTWTARTAAVTTSMSG